jgi:hypothetical protein
MKITKRVREEAAVLLSMLASQTAWRDGIYSVPGVSLKARTLANLAVGTAIYNTTTDHGWLDGYAEAEAMLRTGWKP